jgi:hypothetical protein
LATDNGRDALIDIDAVHMAARIGRLDGWRVEAISGMLASRLAHLCGNRRRRARFLDIDRERLLSPPCTI